MLFLAPGGQQTITGKENSILIGGGRTCKPLNNIIYRDRVAQNLLAACSVNNQESHQLVLAKHYFRIYVNDSNTVD